MFKDKSLLTSAAASADDASLTTQIVDTFYKIYGTHPGFRVNHAKGVVAEGSFVATPAASALSRAALFDGSSIPVTVRFSNDGGLPARPDRPPSNPKGMANNFPRPGGGGGENVFWGGNFLPGALGKGFPRSAGANQGEPRRCTQADQAGSIRRQPPDVPRGLRH